MITVYCNGTMNAINSAIQQIDSNDPNREGTIILNEGTWQWNLLSDTPVRIHGGIKLVSTGFPVDAGLNRNPKTWRTIIEVSQEVNGGAYRNIDGRNYPAGGGAAQAAQAVGYHWGMMNASGYIGTQDQRPVEIAGIHFKGYCQEVENSLSALAIDGIIDFQIHHVKFENFSGFATSFGSNGLGQMCRGVVYNYEIDNPYKDTYGPNNIKTPSWDAGPDHGASAPYACLRGSNDFMSAADKQWAYGFGIFNNLYHTDDLQACLGNYYADPPVTSGYGGKPVIVYMEDGWIRKCRHSTAAGGIGATYVLRHSIIEDCIIDWYSSLIDAHPKIPPYPYGPVLTEIYNNQIIGYPSDERSETRPDGTIDTVGMGKKYTRGLLINGGAAMIHSNSITGCNTAIQFGNYGTGATKCFVWNNSYGSNNTDLLINTNPNYPVYNVDYFSREPTASQDGITYTPFTYPHPLRLGNQGLIEVRSTTPNVKFNLQRLP